MAKRLIPAVGVMVGTLAQVSATASAPVPASAASAFQSSTTAPPAAAQAPSDAEKIARLQRSIDEATRQLDELNGKLSDPASEFRQAEAAFAELDSQLTGLRRQLASLSEDDAGKEEELRKTLAELEPKHKLAKERFDLAIQERKTLQEQVATLQSKIQQDAEALKRLKGETPTTSQPGSQPAAQETAEAARQPESSPVQPAEARQAAPAQHPLAPPAEEQPSAPAAGEQAGTATLAPEVIEAREMATRKQEEAKSAQQEVASITERMNALHRSIELETKQLATSRQKADNAQQTERTLYDTLQKRLQEGGKPEELGDLREQISAARQRLRETQAEIRERTDRLNDYQNELAGLQSEQIAAMQEAQKRAAESEAAQKRVESLESPLSPRNLWRWLLVHGPKVGGILIAMFALLWVTRLADKRIVYLMSGRADGGSREDRESRARTLVGVAHSAANVAIYAGGGLMVLTEVGVNIIPLMGGAAVFGLAVAFGAQNLIRDYFYGFMILLENQYTLDDVVKIGDVSGQVESITLRVTKLRGLDGTLHIVPNGEITRVSNMTYGWSRALFDIPVAYKEDVDRVMEELVELAKELRRDQNFRGLILEMPEMLGVDEFADSAVVIKFFIKTRPLKQWTVKRELLRRIKKRFDQLGIEIPFPHRSLYLQGLPPEAKALAALGDASHERSDEGRNGR